MQTIKKSVNRERGGLFKTYLELWKEGHANKGFSPRLPDYGAGYWFDLLEQALPLSRRNFLDIGAGNGRLSMLLLHTYSPAGVGIEVDANEKDWEPITNRFGRFELRNGLLQDIVPEFEGKRTFDFIVLSEVFEHIPLDAVDAFVGQLYGLLAPGGHIFLTTPNVVVQGPADKSYMWHEKMPYGHHKHYSAEELKIFLSKSGFKILWHRFECHTSKKNLYNRWYYPLARLDDRLLHSSKIPKVLRLLYRPLSSPVLALCRGMGWLVGKAVCSSERKWCNENNASTIVMAIKKDA